MAALTESAIEDLLQPYLAPAGDHPISTVVPPELYAQLATYLDLLLKWNARTNLTAIRDPEEIVRRHFGESLFAGLQLVGRVADDARLLDFGSGAGFPGLPIQLLLPGLRVTLAESQGKKASFLREAVRVLGLSASTTVWAGRVEDLPDADRFDVVTLRAVDRMEVAVMAARGRVAEGGWLVQLVTEAAGDGTGVRMPGGAPGWVLLEQRNSR